MISQELLQSFIAEASDLLDDVEPALVGYPKLEGEAERVEVVNRVFRHFHSIKGSAGFVGLHDIARLTHEAEAMLEQFRRTPNRVIPPEAIAILCRTVDFLRMMFSSHDAADELSEDGTTTVEFNDLINAISRSARQTRDGSDLRDAPAEISTDGRAERISRDTEIRRKIKTRIIRRKKDKKDEEGEKQPRIHESSDTARIIRSSTQAPASKVNSAEFLGRYVAEANELLEQTEQALLQSEQHPELGNESVQEALRCLHSFKGNSGLMNLRDLERMSHRMETEVETILGKDMGMDAAIFDVLLCMIDVLKQAVLDLSLGGSGDIPDTDVYIAMLDDSVAAKSTSIKMRRDGGGVRVIDLKTTVHEKPPEIRLREKIPEAVEDATTTDELLKPRGLTSIQENLGDIERSSRIVIADAGMEDSSKKRDHGADNPGGAALPIRKGASPKNEAPPKDADESAKITSNPLNPKRVSGQKIAVTPRNDIRVDLNKLDALLNLVGELVIAEAMVTRHPVVSGTENESLDRAVHQLRRVATSLQDMAMSVRMIPLVSTFRRMVRLVYDLSIKASKQVDLILLGEETEVDRTVIERISDPMVHIIRNAIDHGIEPRDERERLGKPETGRVTIEGRHEGGEVWIIITDDGRGLDRESILRKAVSRGLVTGDGSDLTDKQVYQLIFEPGFSTAEQVTDISGRGFGMDVVKKNIEKLSGRVDIKTRPGEGMAVIMRIPLTLAIIDGMLIRVGESRYIIPLLSIRESLRPGMDQILHTPDGQPVIKLRDELIPIVMLNEVFSRVKTDNEIENGILMVVEGEFGGTVALFADELLGQQETVIKGLTGWMKKSRGVSGCTILGDGEVGLILDISAIVQAAGRAGS